MWSHLITLYEKTREDSGLYIGHKLKQEHIRLTSYSRMNVRLAAQVHVAFTLSYNKIYILGIKQISGQFIINIAPIEHQSI